jgi:MFS transporter, DHA1 family, multidrug resistance protein
MSTSAFPEIEVKERKLPQGFSMAGLTFILAALSWVGPFSIDTYLPSIPSIAKDLHAPTAQVQQTMTAFLFFFAIMSLWHGAISDAYGRRRLVLISLGIFFFASIGCALSRNITLLMCLRAVQGATAGAGMIIGRAVVRDLFDGAEAQRLMSHVATIFTIAPVMGPIMGGWFQHWFGWKAIFIFMAVMGAFLLICGWFWLPETLKPEKRQSLDVMFLARSYWKVLTAAPFILSSTSFTLANAGFFIYILSAPVFLVQHLGLKDTQYIYMFLPISIGMVIGAWISGRCAGKMTGKNTIFMGYAVMAIAAIGNVMLNWLFPPMLPWALMPVFIYVMGMSISMPSLTLITLDLFPSQRGLAASCQGFLALGANSIVSACVALFWRSPLTLAVTMTIMLTGAVLTIMLYVMATKRLKPAATA